MGPEEELLAPRLEDAGLEDCALPPDSIAEAFSLAAAAVSSRLPHLPLSGGSDEDEDEGRLPAPLGGCVDDAGPALVGGAADEVALVGGGDGGAGDAVVVGGRGEEEDRVVVVGEWHGEKKLGKEDSCVEGVREGAGGSGQGRGNGVDEEEVAAAAEKAILVPDSA